MANRKNFPGKKQSRRITALTNLNDAIEYCKDRIKKFINISKEMTEYYNGKLARLEVAKRNTEENIKKGGYHGTT